MVAKMNNGRSSATAWQRQLRLHRLAAVATVAVAAIRATAIPVAMRWLSDRLGHLLAILAQESRKVTIRLKIGLPGLESISSTMK